MGAPYLVKVGSQKGGVGKSTVTVNIATILAMMNYKVLLVDADTINPSLGFYLGLEDVNIGYMDVAKKKVSLAKAVITHEVTGIQVLPGTPHTDSQLPSISQLSEMIRSIKRERYDFVITDTPPGMYVPGTSRYYDENIIISTPDMSSTTSAVRLAHLYSKANMRHTLVVNRVRDKRYELSIPEIEEAYGNRAMCVLPEDDVIPKSIAQHVPAMLLDGRAPFSRKIRDCTTHYFTGRVGGVGMAETKAEIRLNQGGGMFAWLKRFLHL